MPRNAATATNMGMFVDLKQGESVIAFRRGDETCRMVVRLEKKLGNTVARLHIEADQQIVLLPPSKQESGITPQHKG